MTDTLGGDILVKQEPSSPLWDVYLAAGVNEAAASVAVAALKGTDSIIAVLVLTTAAAIASAVKRPAGDFHCDDGHLVPDANKVDNTGNQYWIFVQHTA